MHVDVAVCDRGRACERAQAERQGCERVAARNETKIIH
jgi:hypothetical protein